jgi:hypothetical protein
VPGVHKLRVSQSLGLELARRLPWRADSIWGAVYEALGLADAAHDQQAQALEPQLANLWGSEGDAAEHGDTVLLAGRPPLYVSGPSVS